MPTILSSGPYRFYFYSHEPNEPAHVHVDRDDVSAKFWLRPMALASNLGFGATELRSVTSGSRIQQVVKLHEAEFMEAWDGYFGADGR